MFVELPSQKVKNDGGKYICESRNKPIFNQDKRKRQERIRVKAKKLDSDLNTKS